MTEESSANNYNLGINAEQIKFYIRTLVKKVVIPSKKQFIEDHPDVEWSNLNIRIHIEETDGKVMATWNDVEDIDMDKFNEIIKSNLEEAKSTNQIKVEDDKRRYFFTVNLDPKNIGKMIGVEGSNINTLKESIKDGCMLDKLPFIKLNDTGYKSTTKLDVEVDEEGSGIWIKIEYFGNKNYKKIKEICEEFITEIFQVESKADGGNDDGGNDDGGNDDGGNDGEGNGW